MAEENRIGFKGLGSYGNDKKSIVKPKDELNSGGSTSYSKVMSSGQSSSDPFNGLNEPLAMRVQAFNDRRQMRRDARTERLVGGKDMIKSSFTPTAEEGSKLYEKNLKLQNKLNKKVVKPTGSPKANNMSAKQAADEERFKKIASKFYTTSQLKLSPTPGSMSSSNLNIWSNRNNPSDPNYSNNMDFSENVKKFQAKHGAKDINEWENKNALEDKDKTNAKF